MRKEFYYKSQDGETEIHAIEWLPEGKPRAVLQIAHGMVEFIGRYDDFATFMANNGVYVVGNDHLGHGLSVKSERQLGYFHQDDGIGKVLGDMDTLRNMTVEKFPNVPYFILGHSMGSFLTRQYIARKGDGLNGAIIMGTGYQSPIMLGGGSAVSKLIATFKGWEYRSKFVDNMAFGAYNKKFRPARTSKDWLTKDEKIVDAYLANKLDTFVFTLNGYKNLFISIKECQDIAKIDAIPKALPILLVSGKDDPVGACGKGVTKVKDMLVAANIKDVTLKLYEGDRHEILNEINKSVVYDDLLAWIGGRL